MNIPIEQLKQIIMNAYQEGFASFEIVDAGLEPHDPEGYADYVIAKLTPQSPCSTS